jgi:hypothetical protein
MPQLSHHHRPCMHLLQSPAARAFAPCRNLTSQLLNGRRTPVPCARMRASWEGGRVTPAPLLLSLPSSLFSPSHPLLPLPIHKPPLSLTQTDPLRHPVGADQPLLSLPLRRANGSATSACLRRQPRAVFTASQLKHGRNLCCSTCVPHPTRTFCSIEYVFVSFYSRIRQKAGVGKVVCTALSGTELCIVCVPHANGPCATFPAYVCRTSLVSRVGIIEPFGLQSCVWPFVPAA